MIKIWFLNNRRMSQVDGKTSQSDFTNEQNVLKLKSKSKSVFVALSNDLIRIVTQNHT